MQGIFFLIACLTISPLMSADMGNIYHMIEEVSLDKIKHIYREHGKEAFKSLNVNGDPIIHHAASFGNNDIIDFLLSNKICDIDQRNEDGCTALHRAAFLGYLDTVRFLVKNQADLHAEDKNHLKPIDHAKTLHHQQVVSYLEEAMNPYSDASTDPLSSPTSMADSIYFLDLSL